MDLGKSFGFVFEDERWVTKVLIGGLLIWIPVVNFAVFGYILKVAENVARGVEKPLPEWEGFGDHFMKGLYGVIIALVYFLPVIIISCVIGGAAGFMGAASDNSDAAAGAAMGISLVGQVVLFVLRLATTLVLFPALARFVATNTLNEAFKFSEIISSLRENFTPWLMLLLVQILCGIVGGLGFIACLIGVIFTYFYSSAVFGHALGQTLVKAGLMPAYTDAPTSYEPPTSYQ